MRNFLLALILANLLLLAWHQWVDPSSPGLDEPGSLALYGTGSGTEPAAPEAVQQAARGAEPFAPPSALPTGSCLRVGPLASATAAQETAVVLLRRDIDAVPFARDTQLWLGHWVQIAGFASVSDGEAARRRLLAGGIPDAYLMQDGTQPLISLGVFRDRRGADRVAVAARNRGFEVQIRDRYRPAIEQWLLVRPRPGQSLAPEDLRLADDRILRAEAAPCEGTAPGAPPAELAPRQPEESL